MRIGDLGYDEVFERERIQLGLGDFSAARVVAESRGAYTVRDVQGEYRATITGKCMHEAESREDYPAVGDWVVVTKHTDDHAVIRGILPRRSMLKRTHGDENRCGEKVRVQVIAANVDSAFIVESVDRDYNMNRIERYCAIARNGGVQPVIVLNKIDTVSPDEVAQKTAELEQRFAAYTIITTSVREKHGVDRVRAYIEHGKTYCFLGSSGVGKSSLVNSLLGDDVAQTGEISTYAVRGRHTTTRRQMYFLPSGGMVIDNPGIREVGMDDVNDGIDSSFDAITAAAHACKYTDCTHIHEPGCAVRAAVASGDVREAEYTNYLRLKKESTHYTMSVVQKRKKSRQFGIMKHKAKKQSHT